MLSNLEPLTFMLIQDVYTIGKVSTLQPWTFNKERMKNFCVRVYWELNHNYRHACQQAYLSRKFFVKIKWATKARSSTSFPTFTPISRSPSIVIEVYVLVLVQIMKDKWKSLRIFNFTQEQW